MKLPKANLTHRDGGYIRKAQQTFWRDYFYEEIWKPLRKDGYNVLKDILNQATYRYPNLCNYVAKNSNSIKLTFIWNKDVTITNNGNCLDTLKRTRKSKIIKPSTLKKWHALYNKEYEKLRAEYL